MGGGFVAFLGFVLGLVFAILVCPKFYAPMKDYKFNIKLNRLKASEIPAKSTAQFKSDQRWFYIFLAISLMLMANFVLAFYLARHPTRGMIDSRNEAALSARSASRSAECESRGAALAAATIAVKGQLRDPGSADFPSINDPNTSISYLGQCTFSVISHVSSRNGFGGMNTIAYMARVKFHKSSDRWIVESINMKE